MERFALVSRRNSFFVSVLLFGLILLAASPSAGQRVTATVPVGTTPNYIAVNPVTNKIYVANVGSNNVTVIDGATNAATTVNVGTSPNMLAVNAATNQTYVVNTGSNNVTVIDGATNATTVVSVGLSPRWAAVNAITDKIYVANTGSGSVTVIDGATNSTSQVAVGKGPDIVVLNPVTNKIYVSDGSDGSTTVIDGASNATTTIAGVSGMMAVNPVTNKIWAGGVEIDGVSNAVTKVSAATGEMTLNPLTNQVYVANYKANTVTIIDGATHATSSFAAGSWPNIVVVNPLTNQIYVTDYKGGVEAFDGTTFGSTGLAAGTNPGAAAINPVTNKIYVANLGSATVTVIDGAVNSTVQVRMGDSPGDVAVNPATNELYIADALAVTVLDGTTNGTTEIATEGSPQVIAVNPVTNKIYALDNFPNDLLTVIDGGTNSTTTLYIRRPIFDVAVNPLTNKIYVSGTGLKEIDGATNDSIELDGGENAVAVAVNATTNRIYVVNSTPFDSVTVIDGGTKQTIATISTGAEPAGIAVNSVTNKIYVANSGANSVRVIDGATNSASTIATAPSGSPCCVAVNELTNKIYVLNWNAGSVTVIDGATQGTTTVSVGGKPDRIAVNAASNQIYVENSADNTITVIDGATNTATTIPVGSEPDGIAANSATNKVYVSGLRSNNETVLSPNSLSVVPFGITVAGVPDKFTVPGIAIFGSTTNTPFFEASVTSSFSPTALAPVGLYYQVDNTQGRWHAATVTSGFGANPATYNFQLDPVPVGVHVLHFYATYDAQGPFSGDSPVISQLTTYPFVIMPAPPTMISPAPGSTLSSSTVTFAWNPGAGPVTLLVGTSPGASDLDLVNVSGAGSATVSNIPTDGGTLYVTLKSSMSSQSYTYTEATATKPAPATIFYPTPGSTFTGSSVTFHWTLGAGVSHYSLYVGSTPGAYDIGAVNANFQTSGTVSSIPTTGQTVYVTLFSMIDGVYQPEAYTYTAQTAATPTPATMISPAPGSQLDVAIPTFTWTMGAGVSHYNLAVGTKPGAHDIAFVNAGYHTSANVTGIPRFGEAIYVTLYSLISGAEVAEAYTYTEAGNHSAASIDGPVVAKLPGSTVTFQWTSGTGVSEYHLYAGTSRGAHDVAYINAGSNRSATISNIPTVGDTLWLRLYSYFGSATDYAYTDVAYREAGTPVAATMTSPTSGSTLTGSTATFTWSAGTGPRNYTLYVGTQAGKHDVAFVNAGTNLSATVSNLPTDGGSLFVTLYSYFGWGTKSNSYSYVEAGTAAKAAMISPTNASKLTGDTATFTWTSGTGVTGYSLYLGSGPGMHDIAFVNAGLQTSATVNHLPTAGTALYATLFSVIDGAYQSNAYMYTEAMAGTPTPATMISPAAGSKLTSGTATFTWTTGAGVGHYNLYVGTTYGAHDIAMVNAGFQTSATVSGIPTNGIPFYVTLYSLINGVEQPESYSYVEAGTALRATLTSPGSLSGTTATFTWTTGTGVSKYSLRVAQEGPDNLDFVVATTATSATVTNLPADGSLVYVRLYSYIGGQWEYADYMYVSNP